MAKLCRFALVFAFEYSITGKYSQCIDKYKNYKHVIYVCDPSFLMLSHIYGHYISVAKVATHIVV